MVVWIAVAVCSLMVLASLVLAIFLGKYGQRGPYFQERFGWRMMVQGIWLAGLCLLVVLPVAIGVGTVPRFDIRMVEELFAAAVPWALMAPAAALLLARGQVDLSIGAAMTLAGVIAGRFAHDHSLGMGIVLGLAAVTGMGIINGVIVATTRAPSIFVTLGMAVLSAMLMDQTATGPGSYVRMMNEPMSLPENGASAWFWWPTIILVAIVIMVLSEVTPMGRGSRVLPHEEGMGRRLAVMMPGFVISAVVAGLVGIYFLFRFRSISMSSLANTGDLWRVMQAVTIAVVGGTAFKGRNVAVIGAVVAAIALQGVGAVIVYRNLEQVNMQVVLAALLLGFLLFVQQYHNFFAWMYQRREARKREAGFPVEVGRQGA